MVNRRHRPRSMRRTPSGKTILHRRTQWAAHRRNGPACNAPGESEVRTPNPPGPRMRRRRGRRRGWRSARALPSGCHRDRRRCNHSAPATRRLRSRARSPERSRGLARPSTANCPMRQTPRHRNSIGRRPPASPCAPPSVGPGKFTSKLPPSTSTASPQKAEGFSGWPTVEKVGAVTELP